MIRFERVTEPEDFDEKVRQPGRAWLDAHPEARRIAPFWGPFRSHLAYEWSNYRFSSEWINKSKQTADDEVLDPHEVEDGWFEILLPSLQLVLTDEAPPAQRARAARTLDRLHLRDDERVLRQRQAWYQLYREGALTLEGLRRMAPLIARAVEKTRPAPL